MGESIDQGFTQMLTFRLEPAFFWGGHQRQTLVQLNLRVLVSLILDFMRNWVWAILVATKKCRLFLAHPLDRKRVQVLGGLQSLPRFPWIHMWASC